MARRKKDGAAQIAAILAKFDIQTEKPVVPEQHYQSDTATTVFSWVPSGFQANKCKECGRIFAHNQIIPHGSRVGYCSDVCRRDSWKRSTGLDWFAVDTNREPWDGDPPLIINPEQFKRLEGIANWFIKNRTTLETLRRESQPEEPEVYQAETEYYPTTHLVLQTDDPFGFDDHVSYESEHQHQEVLQTSPEISQETSEPEQNPLEDDPFGFL